MSIRWRWHGASSAIFVFALNWMWLLATCRGHDVLLVYWIKIMPTSRPSPKSSKVRLKFLHLSRFAHTWGQGMIADPSLHTCIIYSICWKTFIFVCYVTLLRTGDAGWLLLFLDDITGWSLVTNVCFYICNRNFSPIFKNKTVIQFKCRREHLEHQHMIQHRPKATHATAAVLGLIACIHLLHYLRNRYNK